MVGFPSPLLCLAENTGVWLLSAQFWNIRVFVFSCKIFLESRSWCPVLTNSKTERHFSSPFVPGFDEGLPSAGPHACPAAPSQPRWNRAKAHSPHIPLFPWKAALFSPVLGAGGRRESPFFFPFTLILLQASIIEGLNLSCSCLLPSFPDSISNKGLWFGFVVFWVFFFPFSFPLQRSKACNKIPTPSTSYSPQPKPSS